MLLLVLIALWFVGLPGGQALLLTLRVQFATGGMLFTGLLGIVLWPLPHGITGGGVGRPPFMMLPADPIRYSGLSTLAGTHIKSI